MQSNGQKINKRKTIHKFGMIVFSYLGIFIDNTHPNT